jgi:hypothetical protein
MLCGRERIVNITDHLRQCCPVDLATCEYFSLAREPATPAESWPVRYGEWLAQQLAERRPVELWKAPAGIWLAILQGGDCGVAINSDQLRDLQPLTTTTTTAPRPGGVSADAGLKAPVELFYSYCHRDEKLRDELDIHLAAMRREGVIVGWHDRMIAAGQEWKGQIDEHLNAAAVILLLVSPHFIESDYCHDVEMRRALERHDAGEARVIPVILRPVDWHQQPFARLQALPKDGKPVTKWPNKDDAFLDVARGIRAAVRALVQTAH